MYTNETDSMLADGGVMQQGGTVDPVSGNDVPPGAMQSEVRDDIDAKLSEGEFVIPADVVRYIGLSTLMKMRDKAKAGLQKMEEIGQMGNAEEVPNAEALHSQESEMDDETFGSEVDSILNEDTDNGEMAFAEGGYVDPTNEPLYKSSPLKGFEMVTMVNESGNRIYIPYLNGKPLLAVPAGYATQASILPPVTDTTTPTGTTPSGTSSGGGGDSGGGGMPSGGTPSGSLGGGFGVSIDPQGAVTAGKSALSSGQAGAVGMVASMLTGIPGLSIAAMAGQKAYTKAAEAEAANLTAAIADTMGVNANQNTMAATAGPSGTGGSAASAAASAAAAAVAAGYDDDAVGAAAQAAANATMGGASATEAAAVGAAAAATVANDIDATDASTGYGAAASQGMSDPGEAASNAADAAAASAAADAAAAGSNDTTAAADNSGNTSGGDTGGGGGYDGGFGDGYSFAEGGFVQKKNKPAVKAKKGLASRK
jgi:hypothetical protein